MRMLQEAQVFFFLGGGGVQVNIKHFTDPVICFIDPSLSRSLHWKRNVIGRYKTSFPDLI